MTNPEIECILHLLTQALIKRDRANERVDMLRRKLDRAKTKDREQ